MRPESREASPLNATAPHGTPLHEDSLAARVKDGDKRALARLISWVENGDSRLRSVLRELPPPATGARVIGLTGAPGAGKSTVLKAVSGVLRPSRMTVTLAPAPTGASAWVASAGGSSSTQNSSR